MASSLSSERPNLPAPGDGSGDPFVSDLSRPTHVRYSDFDQDLFASGPGSSPRQAKKALEAHLAETERRLDEAGKLGTALVSQRRVLSEQLVEVDKLQKQGELGPELRKKLVDIEKEYNELSRDSARAFLPKQRVPSNETNPESPHVPQPRSGRRSVSPSKFESQATGSPSKLSVPNRKIRNQPSNRVHDIEFAAEISTSLIAQVRDLQSLLAERDDELKALQVDKSKLELESESLQQRLRILDESEHRYKDENWNLETRLQEFNVQHKEASDREKKLNQALATSQSEKVAIQKELDEVQTSHAKLAEDHAAATKYHDIELGTAKRNMVVAEGEREAMQRKIDDLTSQNSELAKAFAMQRGRTTDRESLSGVSEDDFETATDHVTPEHSPPPSPVKGTPRHSVLETETMKTSLHHAQRTIQSQRSLLHREKTEKLELRRIIQDLRDDLEKSRNDGTSSNRRSRKVDSKEFKKQSRLLGGQRSSRQEIIEDDPEWEDNGDMSPRTAAANASPTTRLAGAYPNTTDSSDHFDTANDASESAFETANERGTETEDFQTGHEDLSGSDGAETETETTSRGFGRMRQTPNLPAGLARPGNRSSFISTASTSDDEEDYTEIRTPTTTLSAQRSRRRASRGPVARASRQASEEPNVFSSPASFASTNSGTPQAGQSLFAELQDFDGSDDESVGVATPSRRSLRSVTPGSTRHTMSPPPAVPALPKVVMVDSGVMTEPVEFASDKPVLERTNLETISETERPSSMASAIDTSAKHNSAMWLGDRDLEGVPSRPMSGVSYSDASVQHEVNMGEKLAEFPVPPTSPPQVVAPSVPTLIISDIQSEDIEPREEVVIPPAPPTLTLTSLATEKVEPREEPEPPLPDLKMTSILAEHVDPIAEPAIPPPMLSMSGVQAQMVEPIEEIVEEPVITPPPMLSMSGVQSQMVEPITEVVEEPVITPPPMLSLSGVQSQVVEPVEEVEEEPVVSIPEPVVPPAPELTLSSILAEGLEPVHEPEPAPTPLAYSSITAEHVEPVLEPLPVAPPLGLSSIRAEHVHPIMEPTPAPPALALSSIAAENVEPRSPPVESPVLPNFEFSNINSVETQPITARTPWRDAFIIPRDRDSPQANKETPETPTRSFVGLNGRDKTNGSPPFIAEDETRQSPRDTIESDTPESQRPFKEISSNANARPTWRQPVQTSDQGAQTSLTADAIDAIVKSGRSSGPSHQKNVSISTTGSGGSSGTVRIHRSQESLGQSVHSRSKGGEDSFVDSSSLHRPGSAASGRGSVQDAPPLPSNHRQLIEAARTSSSGGPQQGNMGPPLWPASAMKNRPQTPNQSRPMSAQSGRGTPTPRAVRSGSTYGNAEVRSPTRLTGRSRQSSVSSFASELENRFNMRPGEMGLDPSGFGPNTDPRMIQAITQTMIGEFLWKYTRKTGRGDMSEKRHRRYFWVHPYTRTLYWSDRDPSSGGRSELKTKSVPIEAVRVVTDDNPMPPGLHRKSLVIISPGRTVKFTCTTGQRHETWFNALSYLLLRTNHDQADVEEMTEHITREDVDEFNPQYGRRPANGSRTRPPPSLSSYNSRASRNESPAGDMSMNIPTLTPTGSKGASAQRASTGGTLSKISGYFNPGGMKLSGTLSSLRNRNTTQSPSIYEASEVHDSAEDLREMIERQDREADRLENVRACCDGKHDVGTLPHHTSRRGRGSHTHGHPAQSSNTPMSSMRSRA